jgi:hypothetical protein
LRDLEAMFSDVPVVETTGPAPVGGIVPHAGWVYSGAVAARVFAAIAAHRQPATFVVFGAVHRRVQPPAVVFGSGAWKTPLGEITVDDRFIERVAANTSLIADDPWAHEQEHSIEVQVGLIQHRFADARLVPILVRPTDQAEAIGRAVGRVAAAYESDVVFIGSSDLTHYGPRFGFTPQGAGVEGFRWAKEVNDRRIIEQILELRAGSVVAEARTHGNACGGGAIAATIAACQELGVTQAHLLGHTTSAEVVGDVMTNAFDGAVGYAAVLFA